MCSPLCLPVRKERMGLADFLRVLPVADLRNLRVEILREIRGEKERLAELEKDEQRIDWAIAKRNRKRLPRGDD